MNKIIKIFGQIVAANIHYHPQRVLSLLNAAYAVSQLVVKYFPDQKLLPHQKYAAAICNNVIRQPLKDAQDTAVVNIFLPCELLHAMDIAPQFVEGLAGYLNGAGAEKAFIDFAEHSGIPKTYCSYHKTLLGAALSGVLPKPSFVVNTTLACDANNLTFRTLADYWKIPRFTIDVPNEYNDDTVEYVAHQFRAMVAFIEDVADKKLDMERLKTAIRSENRSLSMYRAYFKELSSKFMPNNLTSEMYKLFFTHILLGTQQAEHYFKLLLYDVQNAAPSKDEIRILWAHTLPYWQPSIAKVFNFSSKYQLLSCDLNFDYLIDMDEDHPYQSMAQKLLLNTMGGCTERRAQKLLDMAISLHADGAIYFNHWGCKKTLGGAVLTKEMLEEQDIPVLMLDGDGCDRNNVNDGQMLTRLQAFLEILEGSK
ncbi:MAG: 2-hydroxyacyl-CoA dehydratase family protein [Clostridia bacterium]|nr:2-hydroxyacyl-CoA dehydratase family protein [Clostridia bacterium]